MSVKSHKSIFACFSTFFLMTFASFCGVLQKWSCETSEISSHDMEVYHGETVEMQCQMLSYGRVVSGFGNAEFLWQTNGMGNAWWTTNATMSSGYVKFNWTPWYDSGAEKYTFFFRVTDAKGANYRANGTLTMLGSPSTDIQSIPIPSKTLDFGNVDCVNVSKAPFIVKSGVTLCLDNSRVSVYTNGVKAGYLSLTQE